MLGGGGGLLINVQEDKIVIAQTLLKPAHNIVADISTNVTF